jgi:hypothetical protein
VAGSYFMAVRYTKLQRTFPLLKQSQVVIEVFVSILRGFKGDPVTASLRSHTSAGALIISLPCCIPRESQCFANGTILSSSRTQIAYSGTEDWDTSFETHGTDGSSSWSA